MSRVGLTEDEEKHIMLLLEGDLSDVEGFIDDDDEDAGVDEDELLKLQKQYDPDPAVELVNMPESNNIQMELEAEPVEEDYDSEDNLPLSTFININKKRIRPPPKWRNQNIDPVNSECHSVYTNTNNTSPLSYFKLFFDEDLIEEISEQTNLYSVQQKSTSVNTTFTEMCQFLGINILSGIVRMPSYRMYWAQETQYAPIAERMSRNRFDKLRNFIHINDNSNILNRDHPDYDKLFKIRPLLDKLKQKFSLIENEECQSVDEIMIPFKGRSSLKQFMQNKPHKWGIKVFARAGVSGIIYDFEIYRGKGTVPNSTLGISGDIVMRLIEKLPKNMNYKIFMDNWFTSYSLLCELKAVGILATGTVRIARIPGCQLKNDSELKREGRGSFDYCTDINENILVTKWFDNRSVHVASSYAGIDPIENVKRWSSMQRRYIEVPRPNIVKVYNKNMGGVDLNDMLVSLYRTKLGVKRFYLRIVYHLMDICIVNAWLLYRRDCNLNGASNFKRLVTFRAEIAHALLQQNSRPRKRGRPTSEHIDVPPRKRPVNPRPLDDVRYDGYCHWPEHIEPKKRCRECVKAYTRMSCSKCKMPLCITKDKNCFVKFHTK